MRVVSLLLAFLVAGCSCPFHNVRCPFGHKVGLQHPEMTPEKKDPVPAVGAAPASPWSVTTVEAAVPDKDGVKTPRSGAVKSFTGEVVDMSCYLQLGKHGAKHKECGQKCARAGQPIGLLMPDGDLFLLMAEEHHPRRDGQTGSLRDALIEHMADIVTVTGTATEVNGARALFVSGFAK